MRAWLLAVLAACSSGKSRPDAGALGEDLGRRLTEAECEKSVDHVIQLMERAPGGADVIDQLLEDRPTRVTACMARGTLRDFRCLTNAKSVNDLGSCRALPE